jgi:hypothetical protein
MYQAFSQGTCTWVSFEGLQSFQYNQFNFRATVDPNNSIAESNESNNSTTATIATYRGNITSSNNSPVYYVSQPSIDLEIVGIQSLSNNSGLAEITLCNR